MEQCSNCLTTYPKYHGELIAINGNLMRSYDPEEFTCPCCGQFPKSKTNSNQCPICKVELTIESVKLIDVCLSQGYFNLQRVLYVHEICPNNTCKAEIRSYTDFKACIWPYNGAKKYRYLLSAIEQKELLDAEINTILNK